MSESGFIPCTSLTNEQLSFLQTHHPQEVTKYKKCFSYIFVSKNKKTCNKCSAKITEIRKKKGNKSYPHNSPQKLRDKIEKLENTFVLSDHQHTILNDMSKNHKNKKKEWSIDDIKFFCCLCYISHQSAYNFFHLNLPSPHLSTLKRYSKKNVVDGLDKINLKFLNQLYNTRGRSYFLIMGDEIKLNAGISYNAKTGELNGLVDSISIQKAMTKSIQELYNNIAQNMLVCFIYDLKYHEQFLVFKKGTSSLQSEQLSKCIKEISEAISGFGTVLGVCIDGFIRKNSLINYLRNERKENLFDVLVHKNEEKQHKKLFFHINDW